MQVLVVSKFLLLEALQKAGLYNPTYDATLRDFVDHTVVARTHNGSDVLGIPIVRDGVLFAFVYVEDCDGVLAARLRRFCKKCVYNGSEEKAPDDILKAFFVPMAHDEWKVCHVPTFDPLAERKPAAGYGEDAWGPFLKYAAGMLAKVQLPESDITKVVDIVRSKIGDNNIRDYYITMCRMLFNKISAGDGPFSLSPDHVLINKSPLHRGFGKLSIVMSQEYGVYERISNDALYDGHHIVDEVNRTITLLVNTPKPIVMKCHDDESFMALISDFKGVSTEVGVQTPIDQTSNHKGGIHMA